jgi:hypothetical protein
MQFSKRFRLITIFAILFAALIASLTQVDSVQATFNNAHAFTVLLRVETEILQKTSAGRYYDALFWKHAGELNQIISSHPEHNEALLQTIRVFVPGLEALLDGKGDTVYITPEHVERLKVELDWFASIGSPALQEDIQRERQRLPLDNFVDMTMSDALDFINSSWIPDMIEQTLVPYSIMQPTEPVSVVDQTLVPGSNGNWAYYVHNGVYFEYPTNYYLQVMDTMSIKLIPSPAKPEELPPYQIIVNVWNVPIAEKDRLRPDYWYPAESIVWVSAIQNEEFEGIEFISSLSNPPVIHIDSVQYNQENQLAVRIDMDVSENLSVPDGFDYSALVDQRYAYFKHMADSLHIQVP